MATFGQDLRYGARTLLKSPGFTAVAVLTLAVGIGANTAIFSAVNAMLVRPLPVAEGERLVGVYRADARREDFGEMSYPDYVDLRDRGDALSGVLGHKLAHVGLDAGGGEAELVWGELVTGNYFDVLGVAPAVGRGFLPEEDRTPGAHPVAVISHGLWQRRFAGDPAVAGKVVKINGRDYTIVGVAPEQFRGTKFALALDIWLPIMMHDQIRTGYAEDNAIFEARGNRWLEVLGRLKPGVSLEQAQASLAALGARLAEEHPDTNAGTTVAAFPERDTRFGEDSQRETKLAAGFLMLVVGMVLLIACANVSNLLLARASERHREIGVRLALGASRWRVVRQLLTESALLAALGGVAGVLIAVWGVGLLRVFIPPVPYPVVLDASPDARVLAFSLAVMLAASLVFGLAPALHASKLDVVSVLKGSESGAGGRARHRLRNALVVSQLALAFVLLVGAGLCLKSLANAETADPGFDARNVLFLTVDLGLLGYDGARQRDFYRRLVESVEVLPGVRSANAVDIVPLGDSHNSSGPLVAEGRSIERPEDEFGAGASVVGPGHFETLGIPILRGRDFTDADTPDSRRVIVVNETLAERLWPGEDAIGKRFRVGRRPDAPLREVVGVVKTGKYWSLGEAPRRYMYFPLSQTPSPEMTVLVRTEGDPLALAGAVRDEVRRLDPNLPVYDVKSLATHLGYALWAPRMGASLSALFGLVALLLAVVGLYGVMSYLVSQQTREIGIRMALGALPRDVLRMVVGRSMLLTAAGVGVGLAGALALTRGLSGLLFGVSPVDPWVFVGIPLLLAAVAFVATYAPARRATRVDPMTALRYQ